MNPNQIDLKKTGILFFDILNGYYHQASEANRARKKPMVEGAMRVMKAGRQAGIPIFFAKGNHRADGATSVPISVGLALINFAISSRERASVPNCISCEMRCGVARSSVKRLTASTDRRGN